MPRVRVAASLCVSFVLAACGTSDPPLEGPTSGPQILEFGADPVQVREGASATLFWKTSGATGVEVFAGDEAVELGSASPASGRVEVRPSADTEYRLVATAADGAKREASTTVTVVPVERPTIVAFTATPETLVAGEAAVLSWITENADSVRVLAAGMPIDLEGAGAAEGSVEVKPVDTTIYTLEAYRDEVRETATVSIGVRGSPRITFTASTDVVDFSGSPATLSWTVTDATRVVIADGASTLSDGSEATGTLEVSPTNQTTYTLTAEGPGGTSTAEVEVAVRPLIDSFSLADAGPWALGAEVEVRWTVFGAEELTVSNLDGFSFTTTLADGSVTAPISFHGFRLTAVREGVEAVRDLAVLVAPTPAIISFAAAPEVVTATPGVPSTTNLAWSLASVESYRIEASTGETIVGEREGVPSGSIPVAVDRDTTFMLHAKGYGVETNAEVVVRAAAPSRIDTFKALPTRVGAGESFLLTWSTTDAWTVRLVQDGAIALPIEPTELSGSFTTQVAADAQITLRATNLAGDFVEQTVSIGLGAPLVHSFTADEPIYDPGDTVRLDWQVDGGTTLAVMGPGGPVPGCGTADLEAIAAGGCSFVVPTAGETLDLELVVTNGVGQETREPLSVEVRGAARILSFTRQADKVTVGDAVVFTWDVTTDALGQPAILTLEDDLGGTWPLDGKDPQHDTLSIVAAAAGTRTYTLTATSSNQTEATATVTVEVFEAPVIGLTTLDPAYDPDSGAPLVLRWNGTAAAVSIFEVDSAGNEILPAIYEADPSDIALGRGFVDVTPVAPTEWVAVATNGAGRTALASTAVSFVPVQVASFQANPDQIVAGATSTLSWTTSGAAWVEILGVPTGHAVGPSAEPFIDLSASASAQVVPYGDSCNSSWVDEGCPLVTFPAGFSFPFFGETYTSARVYVNGFISFDTVRMGSSYELEELPSTWAPFVHLAPYWSDLENVNGRILYETGVDAKGNYLVIQWSHYSFAGSSDDMNFEIVMWDDGDFDFRYATMSSSWPEDALGEFGSIGYQNLDGTIGESITYFTLIPGLQNSGYSFRAPRITPSGTLDVHPAATTEYELVAHGWDGTTQSLTATVSVSRPVTIDARITPSDVDQGESFTIEWTAASAVAITISDASGPVHVAAPGELEEGSLTLVASTLGANTFTITADGPLGTQATDSVTVTVWEPFGLDSFVVDDPEIAVGGSTSLSWTSHGAESFSLTANGVDLDLTGYDPDSGAMPISPAGFTTYTFTIARLDGRSFSQTRTVRVVRVQLDLATLDVERIGLGGQVNLTWSASSPSSDAATVRVMPTQMVEPDPSEPGHAFEDISATGAELTDFAGWDAWGEEVVFPGGFAFPYMDEIVTAIRIEADGYLSLNPDQETNYSNVRLPGGRSGGIALAPFWDDLHAYSTGRVHTQLVSDGAGDRFIVQWTAFQYYTSSGAPGANLNFQVALFADGSFEYRYGTMASPSQARADGSSATIGYQDRRGSVGVTLSIDAAISGGLSNRTWRFEALAPTGTAVVSPGRDGTVLVCASAAGDRECRTLHVDVLAPGDLVLTELMLDPTGGPGDQWFEVRNLSARAIDLEGLEIVSGTDTHLVSFGMPLLVQPGEYATLAAGATPGFPPDYVYGGLVFDPTLSGDLSVRFGGVVLTNVAWTSSWNIPTGASLSLDGAAHAPSVASGALGSGWWCESDDAFGSGDAGSPGAAGVGCRYEYDVDFHSTAPFIDISTTGTDLPGVISNGSSLIPGGIPFSFPFYMGSARTTVYAAMGGQVYFAEFCFFGWCFPDDWEGLVSVYADYDLEPQAGSSVKYKVTTVGSRQVMIVQWTNFTRWSSQGSLTFQAQLWEGGDIVFAYPVLQGGADFRGSEADISLTSVGAVEVLEYSSFEESLREGQSIHFHYR